jgi:hypothetical protein
VVYVDDRQIGATPVSVSFVYYGTRKIQLMKDGFETITVKETFSPPWYEFPGVDFFSENVYPGELRDERVLDFQLEPAVAPTTQELWQRGESLRSGARAGPITLPAAGAAPVGSAQIPLVQPAPVAPAEVVAPPVGVAAPPFSPPAIRLPPTTQMLPNPILFPNAAPVVPGPLSGTIPFSAPPDSIRPFPSP